MDKKLYVGNLSFNTTEDDLRDAFGGATYVKVIVDRETGQSRGFGFVSFATDDEAKDAQEKWDGKELDGRALKVNEAQEKPREARGGARNTRGSGGPPPREFSPPPSGGNSRPNWSNSNSNSGSSRPNWDGSSGNGGGETDRGRGRGKTKRRKRGQRNDQPDRDW